MALTDKNISWRATIDTSSFARGADDIKKNLDSVAKSEKKAAKGATEFQNSIEKVGKKSSVIGNLKKSWLAVTAVIGGVVMGVKKIISAVKEYVDLAQKQILAEKKLATILKERTNANSAQIKSILELTEAQQQLGVIGDEVQIAGAQQLATFVRETSTIETLIPAMNNLLAQQKGLNATQEDAVNIGNLVGKVLNGQYESLSRVGISFSEAQKEVLKYGTESERASMLAKIITENVGNMNAELAKTDAGKIQQAKNMLGDFKEEIGKFLMPLLSAFYTLLVKTIETIINTGKKLSESFKENMKESTAGFKKLSEEVKTAVKELGITEKSITFQSLL